jgi:vacuolar-type H+-ATPase subunit F/Vma7
MVQYQYSLLFHATETTVKQIEDAFKEFTTREDIAIVLISQYVSEPSNMHNIICVLMHC